MGVNEHYNPEIPLVMHIDLNSCFATVEQQAQNNCSDRYA